MRDKTFYKEKAEAIKNEVLEIQNKDEALTLNELLNTNKYSYISEIICEFVHLVYSFDKNLPLNKRIQSFWEQNFINRTTHSNVNFTKEEFEEINSIIDFFLHYLDTFAD